jgi:cytochrome P450
VSSPVNSSNYYELTSRSINTNAYRLCFWCLAFLLFDTELRNEIAEEMRPAWLSSDKGSLDMAYLLDNCPLLSSFYEEVLRFTVDSIGARVVAKKTTVGSKVLTPGKKLLMPFRQGHFDSDIFGQDAATFNPRRFLTKTLSRSTSWKPFGGGLAWCPGRFMAQREVYMFIGLVLLRFDLDLHSPDNRTPVFPTIDETFPYGGILAPKPGQRVMVEIKEL